MIGQLTDDQRSMIQEEEKIRLEVQQKAKLEQEKQGLKAIFGLAMIFIILWVIWQFIKTSL